MYDVINSGSIPSVSGTQLSKLFAKVYASFSTGNMFRNINFSIQENDSRAFVCLTIISHVRSSEFCTKCTTFGGMRSFILFGKSSKTTSGTKSILISRSGSIGVPIYAKCKGATKVLGGEAPL